VEGYTGFHRKPHLLLLLIFFLLIPSRPIVYSCFIFISSRTFYPYLFPFNLHFFNFFLSYFAICLFHTSAFLLTFSSSTRSICVYLLSLYLSSSHLSLSRLPVFFPSPFSMPTFIFSFYSADHLKRRDRCLHTYSIRWSRLISATAQWSLLGKHRLHAMAFISNRYFTIENTITVAIMLSLHTISNVGW
jgi:hypothetical protein